MKITELVPDSKNANKGTLRGLKELDKSLRRNGAGRSILIDAHNRIIAGNKTVDRAADIGLDDVIVVETDGTKLVAVKRTDLDLEQGGAARELAYADNWVGQIDLDWDAEQVLADLEAGSAELQEMLKDLAEHANIDIIGEQTEDPGAQIDKADELREKWQTETGQLWQVGEHRVICGDCTDAEVVAKVMQGEKAELVVTSPPYAVGKEYEAGVSFAEHLALLENIADRCIENVVPGGFIFTNFGEIAPQSHAGPLTGSKRQCIYLISKDYWRIFHDERRCDLYAQRIWHKPFNRLQQPFWSYHTSIPHHQEWEHIWTWRTPGGDTDTVHDWDISVHAIWDTRNESVDDKPLTRHTAAFPVCLPERAIKAHSDAGDIVLDPFLGSGTTLVACERLGRKGRGIEISPSYVAVTLERLAGMNLMPELVS